MRRAGALGLLALLAALPAGAGVAGTDRLAAGFRFSTYGPDYDPGPEYWRDVGLKMAGRFPGSVPSAVWIVGRLKGPGCEASFPGKSASPLIRFTGKDGNEEALSLFDRAGFEVWLQIEPGNAPVEELIHQMLERYGRHPSIVGVGVDVEWYKSVDEPEGQAVTDAEARTWLAAAREHDPSYRLFLKHWLASKMPPNARDGLFFIDDSQRLPSLETMVDEFAAWARAFAPAPVGFQIGYETDRPWWGRLADPPADIGRPLLARAPNTRGIYWVDFSVLDVFPPGPAHASGGTATDQPPGGLGVRDVPQFVVLGFDDNGHASGVRFVVDSFAGRRNPSGRGNPRTYDGTPAHFSFYAATRYIESAASDTPERLKPEWRRVLDAGHEVGLHTHNHAHGAGFKTSQWDEEIATCIRWLKKPFAPDRLSDPSAGIGVPRETISGFRAPFLEHGRPLFPALRASGIDYDCSLEEGSEARFDGTNLLWPYRIAPGYGGPGDRELWELPVYALTVPPDEECARYGVPPRLRARLKKVRDYFDPADGKITGFDWNLWVEFGMSAEEVVATFKYSLDRRLAGNRAPLTFGTHSDLYADPYYEPVSGSTPASRRRALEEILDYSLAHPEVRVVSGRQLLDWLRAPASP